MLLTDFPTDILTIVFSLLDAKDFLTLCCTCQTLLQFKQDPAYWRHITSRSFRLPISPLLKAEGPRWYHLYRRLKTQTHVFTWGQGVRGGLGMGANRPRMIMRRGPPRPTNAYQRATSTWPTNTAIPEEITVIADLQCGGWSTSILSSDGKIYTVGIIDSDDGRYIGESVENFTQLHYLTESVSAISQFSSGRRHILALTDDNEILTWDRTDRKGLKVFSASGRDFGGKATRVVAGWVESSAYIPETGIVFWAPVKNDQQDDELDGVHVPGRIIPGTARGGTIEQPIEAIAHVVLEGMIVWLSSDSRLFACEIQPNLVPFQVPGFSSADRKLLDVQGQFNKFVVFTDKDEVLAGDVEYLRRCQQKAQEHFRLDQDRPLILPTVWDDIEQVVGTRPHDIEALQHAHVIKMAFGDHHYQALHDDGRVTTYGTDGHSCGSLGVDDLNRGARFRGLREVGGWGRDLRFIPAAERRGRHIWYEPEKREWLTFLEDSLSKNETLGNDALAEWTEDNPEKQLLFSEWIEQEGEHWSDGPIGLENTIDSTTEQNSSVQDDFHLDAYFTIAIAAAGWHSGALVLVDEQKAHEVREKWFVREAAEFNRGPNMPGAFINDLPNESDGMFVWKLEGFPKVRLPNGYVMPGVGDIRMWRDGEPIELLQQTES